MDVSWILQGFFNVQIRDGLVYLFQADMSKYLTTTPAGTHPTNKDQAFGFRDLKSGSTNDLFVYNLQIFLKDGGYLTSNSTGNFADATLQAVIDFQDAHGLLADGIVGDKTKNALWNAYAVKMQEEGVKELP